MNLVTWMKYYSHAIKGVYLNSFSNPLSLSPIQKFLAHTATLPSPLSSCHCYSLASITLE